MLNIVRLTQTRTVTHFLFTCSGVACGSMAVTHTEATECSAPELTARLPNHSTEAVRRATLLISGLNINQESVFGLFAYVTTVLLMPVAKLTLPRTPIHI